MDMWKEEKQFNNWIIGLGMLSHFIGQQQQYQQWDMETLRQKMIMK